MNGEENGGSLKWYLIGCPMALLTVLIIVIVSLAVVLPMLAAVGQNVVDEITEATPFVTEEVLAEDESTAPIIERRPDESREAVVGEGFRAGMTPIVTQTAVAVETATAAAEQTANAPTATPESAATEEVE